MFFIALPLFLFFYACNSAFEQGHLEPWRYINDFIIIIIIIIIIIRIIIIIIIIIMQEAGNVSL